MKLFHPRLAVVAHDLFMTWAAWMLSYALRYSIWPDSPEIEYLGLEVAIVVFLQGVVAYFFNLYHGLWRFASVPDLLNITKSAVIGTLAIGFVLFLVYRAEGVPRTVLVTYPVVLIVLWGVPRITYRIFKDSTLNSFKAQRQNALLVGAGRLADMFIRHTAGSDLYQVKAIVDERKSYKGSNLRGIKVQGDISSLNKLVQKLDIDVIVICIENISQDEMKMIVDHSIETHCKLLTLPDLDKISEGELELSKLSPLTIDDLLGRKKVTMDWLSIADSVQGKSILITGGGGSIGSELARQLSRFDLKSLTILDHSEFNLYQIDRELSQLNSELIVKSLLVNVTDKAHLYQIFSQVKPDIVFHAAAYKHVPLLEKMPCEGFINNVIGTKNVVDTCISFSVSKMILVSTDKAVNPYSIMGATKRVAETYCQHMNHQSKTDIKIVRFGNVLDSAGSVVPLFREQIEKGGPVTVTHKDMTRYFMTIPEACQLIVQSMVLGVEGDIHVLDMGQPVSILSLAKRMIILSGKTPEKDIEIKITGLRRGEKLHEQLYYEVEKLNATAHKKIYSISSNITGQDLFMSNLNKAMSYAINFNETSLTESIHNLVPEFTHQSPLSLVPSNSKPKKDSH